MAGFLYYVRLTNTETQVDDYVIGDDGEHHAWFTEGEAHAFVEQRAATYFGGADVTWYEPSGGGVYEVGRILGDGSRAPATVTFTIEDIVSKRSGQLDQDGGPAVP